MATAPPLIAADQLIVGNSGQFLSYQIVNDGQAATSWTATGMPVGLEISASGVISGAVAVDGNSVITVTALNDVGSSVQNLGVSIIYSGKQYRWHEAEWALRSNNSIKARRLNWLRKTKAGLGTNMWITFSNPFFYMGENGAKTSLVKSEEFGAIDFTTPDWVLDLNGQDPAIEIPRAITSLKIARETIATNAGFVWDDIEPIEWDPLPPTTNPEVPPQDVQDDDQPVDGVLWAHNGARNSSRCIGVELVVTTTNADYTVDWGTSETTALSGEVASTSYCPIAGTGLVIRAWGDPHWVVTGPLDYYAESFEISGVANGNKARIRHNTSVKDGQAIWLYNCNNSYLNGQYAAKRVDATSVDLTFVNAEGQPVAITGNLSTVAPRVETAVRMIFGDNAVAETILLLFLKYEDGSEWCVHSTNSVYTPNGAQIISSIEISEKNSEGVVRNINPVNQGAVNIGTFCTLFVDAGSYLQPEFYAFDGENITHIGGAMWGMFQASFAAISPISGKFLAMDFGDGLRHDGWNVMGATIGYTKSMWVNASTLLRNTPGAAPQSLYDNKVIVPFSPAVFSALG